MRRRLAGQVIGGRVSYHRKLPSTMDEARRLAEGTAPDGTVVVAEEQTRGRGRFNRDWLSPPGGGLTFSVVVRPVAGTLPLVNMAATLAVCDAVASLVGLNPSVKWPNDVRIRRRKISGILVEATLEGVAPGYAVVGIGLNVNMDFCHEGTLVQSATSLSVESGRILDRSVVLITVLEKFDALYRLPGTALRDQWRCSLDTLGNWVRVNWRGQVLEGKAIDVDARGNLLVRRPDGFVATVTAGEVTSHMPVGDGLDKRDAEGGV